MSAPSFSVVVPVYQNEGSLEATYLAVRSTLDELPEGRYGEIIFINDGSSDNSLSRLLDIQSRDPNRVVVIDLARNFGQVAALFAGYRHARGKAVITISADMQDPPEIMGEMVHAWQRGEKLVLAVRATREEGVFRKCTSYVFYRCMRRLAIKTMPLGGFDYFLMDRQLLETILSIDERNVFLQGQVLWPGVKPFQIPYNRRRRKVGRSQWSLFRKLGYFADGFAAYSASPLRMVSIFGALSCGAALLISIALVIQRVALGTQMAGWTSIMIVMLWLGGFQMFSIGILGEYMWRTLEQTRSRPLFVIRRVYSLSQDPRCETAIPSIAKPKH